MRSVKAVVSGRVQGVWFRAHTQDKARELGVNGWVRNLPDGSVEIVAQGDAAQIDALLSWARHGPPQAEVRDLQVSYLEEDTSHTEFEIRY